MNDRKKYPIRILHVLTAMQRAGAETMLMNLYRAIDREQIQFDFAVSTKDRCDYDDEIAKLGGRIIHYPRYNGWNHFGYVRWWKSFYKKHPEYGIVHGHIGSTASIYLKLAKKAGCITIAHSHSTGMMGSMHDVLYKIYSYRTRFIADYFFGCSTDALVSRYGKRIAKEQNKSYIFKNGIDVKKYTYTDIAFNEVRSSLGIKKDALVVGTVGRFTVAKNVFFIVDIIEGVKRVLPDFRFVWVGSGELKNQVEEYVSQKNLTENVLFLGVRDDVPRILQAMNVFILPSTFEGLPVIGIEVQSAGVPMLCSDRVSPELKLTNCVSFLPIDSIDPWVNMIIKERVFRREKNAQQAIVKSGYDVSTTSKWLAHFYESIDVTR